MLHVKLHNAATIQNHSDSGAYMGLKKRTYNDDEIAIYDEAVVYKRGDYWQMRMWLQKEKKYARFSLRTRNRDTAIDKGKKYYHNLMSMQLSGKTYFSKTTKQGVEAYIQQRQKDVEAGDIVTGRLSTIKTHLEHWLDFIGRDTKLKELEITDCENYRRFRTKTKKKVSVSKTTIANEQSTINALIRWLYKHKETEIEDFDFKPIKQDDKGDERFRRNTFTDEEIVRIQRELDTYIAEGKKDLTDKGNLSKVIVGYYLMLSIMTGLRRGEQRQLTWADIEWLEKQVHGGDDDDTFSLVKIRVRGETSKVGKTRIFVIKDWEYFNDLFTLQYERYKQRECEVAFANTLVFSTNFTSVLTPRSIGYHFDKMLELAEIANLHSRDLVPYSFRHYFITDMINRGASPTQVAETCGTSTLQIERTYYHTSEAKMINNALPQYEYKNGLLMPK